MILPLPLGDKNLLKLGKICMNTDTQADYFAALTDLHDGLEYRGLGDADFSRNILSNVERLPILNIST